MYSLFIVLFTIFILSFIFIDYKSFKIVNNKTWIYSLVTINITLILYYIFFYYKKSKHTGLTGSKGETGDTGPDGQDDITSFNK